MFRRNNIYKFIQERSNINEDIRAVLNIFFVFFYEKILQAQKKHKKAQKCTKSTKKTQKAQKRNQAKAQKRKYVNKN